MSKPIPNQEPLGAQNPKPTLPNARNSKPTTSSAQPPKPMPPNTQNSTSSSPTQTFTLRPEQQSAIDQTLAYYNSGATPRSFLWNAKPRFGKTLAAYRFALDIHAARILILTNRPAVSDSWAQDFFTHIAPITDFVFASSHRGSLTIAGTKHHIYSRPELTMSHDLLAKPLIYFISLQDLKGRDKNLQDFKAKNRWLFRVEKPWDLLIIDEGHEGIKTSRARETFRSLHTNFTLVLSGTPFRALADQDFSDAQIFNWTYLDEQKSQNLALKSQKLTPNAKNLASASKNLASKSEKLAPASQNLAPRLDFRLFPHELDLANPVATNRFLTNFYHAGFSSAKNQHSLWLLSDISACRAMRDYLSAHPLFQNYQLIFAAGKTENYAAGRKVLDQVRAAIGPNPAQTRTITLTCGQLTTGVTVPEWSSVVMLYNSLDLDRISSSQYLQAAFRAQTPAPGKLSAQIFDIRPERALTILRDYAENLCSRSSSANLRDPKTALRTQNQTSAATTALRDLLTTLDIHLYSPEKSWRTLSPQEILDLPQKLIASSIIDGKFIASDYIFNPQTLTSDPHDFLALALEKIRAKPHFAPISNLLQNLAALEPLLASDTADKYDFPNLTSAHQALVVEAAAEIRRLARHEARTATKDLRSHLRDFSRTIPLLLHANSNNFVNSADPTTSADRINSSNPANPTPPTFQTLSTLPHFEEITGLTPCAFQKLLQANYFNCANLDLAIAEFLHRETTLAPYYSAPTFQTIFDLIPAQHSSLVFTPSAVATYIVDLLEHQNPKIFRSQTSTFFDPASKSGLLLAEITRRLFQNLRPDFPSDRDCLAHILTHQIYATAPTPAARTLTLRTLLPAQITFTKSELMLVHDHTIIDNFQGVKNAKSSSFATFAQTIYQDWSHRMNKSSSPQPNPHTSNRPNTSRISKPSTSFRFDVIISNPPYQSGRRQIYADFYKLAVDLDPELLCMVFPLGWQKTYNHNGLGQINNPTYKRDPHIVSIDNYYENNSPIRKPSSNPHAKTSNSRAETSDPTPPTTKLFPELGTGGVNIVLRNRSHNNAGHIQKLEYGQPAGIITLPLASSEIQKPAELTCLVDLLSSEPKMDALGSARKPYGFYADPLKHPEKYNLHFQKLTSEPQNLSPKSKKLAPTSQNLSSHSQQSASTSQKPSDTPPPIRLFGLKPNGTRGYEYIPASELPKTSPCLNAYKLFVPKAWGNMSERIGLGGSYANICVASPGDACSETFIEFGPFHAKSDAIKISKYFMTQFFRALLFLAKDTQNTAKDKYRYIPVPDLSDPVWQQPIPEIDNWLFAHYQVPEPTRTFIRTHIQPRSESNIDLL